MLEMIEHNQLLSFLIVACGLYYFYSTRFIGETPFVKKFAVGTLMLDIIILPILIILLIHFVELFWKFPIFNDIKVNLELVQSALLYLLTFWLIARAIDVIVMQRYFRGRTGYDAPHLLRGLVYIITLFSGLALFLWQIKYPLTGFLVSTGVIAGVIGLAMQNTLGNLFSGIAFSLERPFKTGDWIQLEDGSVGQVVEMTWRSTWFKTFNNTILTMPNLVLASQSIINLDKPKPPYSVWYSFKISPEIDPAFVKTLLAAAVGRCRHLLPKPAPSIRLNSAVANPYIYTVWVHYRNYLAHFKGQEELFMQIHSALRNADIHVSAEVQEVNFSRKRALNPLSLNISDSLRSLSIFTNLNNEEIEQIANASEYMMVDVDTVLMHEKQHVSHVYIVLNGELESSVTLENGHRIEGEQFSSGDSFGWSAVVFEEAGIMTVRAITDSLVLAINRDCLKPVISKHEDLTQRFTDLVTQRIENLDQARSTAARARKIRLTPSEIKKRIEKFLR